MKKIISGILSILLLLSVVPAQAFAVENEVSEHDELIALACEVFPEYASIIRCENNNLTTFSCSDDSNNVVFSETRSVSDTENLTISLLSSGQVIIVENDTSSFQIQNTSSSTSDISTVGVSGTASFKVTCNTGSSSFSLSNVKFNIYYTGSDYFTSYGTTSTNGDVRIGAYQKSSTYMDYPLTFSVSDKTGKYNLLVSFELYFSNDQLVGRIN